MRHIIRPLTAVVSLFATLLSGGVASGCAREEREKTVVAKSAAEPVKAAEVAVMELQPEMFSHEIVSNGKVTGHERADLYLPPSDAVIAEVYVRNGSRVSKGAPIAALDTYSLRNEVEKATAALEKANLELKDALIGQGYDPDNLPTIPADVMRLARLRSGYEDAERTLSEARHKLEEGVLTAPFNGVVANLSAKPFNRPDNSKPLCTLIGNTMDVEFKILEPELPLVAPGDAVRIAPFSSSQEYPGKVTEINPAVDAEGMVTAIATTSNAAGLFDGMNVKVSVLKEVGRQLVVPKSAVVLRTGRQVVFTLSDDGKRAVWNYVQTGLENMGSYTVADGLQPGMKVIVSGNMNLAHEAPVVVR